MIRRKITKPKLQRDRGEGHEHFLSAHLPLPEKPGIEH